MFVVTLDSAARAAPAARSAPAEKGAIAGVDARVRAAAGGDRAAASELLRERLPRVRNLVRYLVRGDDMVDDISQQVLIAILKGLPTYRGEGAFDAWCDRITARETFRYLKRSRAEWARRREAATELRETARAGAGPGDAARYESRRAALSLLESLPPEQREVLVLHHVVGMSMKEVAEAVGIPVETARSRARLGVKRLRREHGAEAPRGDTHDGA